MTVINCRTVLIRMSWLIKGAFFLENVCMNINFVREKHSLRCKVEVIYEDFNTMEVIKLKSCFITIVDNCHIITSM